MSRADIYGYEKGTTGRAWMPGRGRGTLALVYQHGHATDGLFSSDITGRVFPGGYVGHGTRLTHGDVTEHTGTFEADYGVGDRFAVSGSMNYIASRYVGLGGHPALPGHEMIDDGNYHPTFQDFSLGVRYLAASRYLAVIPFVRATIPTHDYVNVGHSAVGRDLDQLQLGANFARRLDPFLPSAYAKAMLAYAFVESPDPALNINKRYASLELGYFATNRVAVNAFGNHVYTDGGIDWARDLKTPADYARVGHVHDAAARDRHLVIGGGLSFAVKNDLWLYAGYSDVVSGQNLHDEQTLAIGMTRSFNTRWSRAPEP